ncbi:hypothetical protein GCM10020001_114200 [Nonomuraea salmonea]
MRERLLQRGAHPLPQPQQRLGGDGDGRAEPPGQADQALHRVVRGGQQVQHHRDRRVAVARLHGQLGGRLGVAAPLLDVAGLAEVAAQPYDGRVLALAQGQGRAVVQPAARRDRGRLGDRARGQNVVEAERATAGLAQQAGGQRDGQAVLDGGLVEVRYRRDERLAGGRLQYGGGLQHGAGGRVEPGHAFQDGVAHRGRHAQFLGDTAAPAGLGPEDVAPGAQQAYGLLQRERDAAGVLVQEGREAIGHVGGREHRLHQGAGLGHVQRLQRDAFPGHVPGRA